MAGKIETLLSVMSPRALAKRKDQLLSIQHKYVEFQVYDGLVPYIEMGFFITESDDVEAMLSLLNPVRIASGDEELLNLIMMIERKECEVNGFTRKSNYQLNSFYGQQAFFAVGTRPIFDKDSREV